MPIEIKELTIKMKVRDPHEKVETKSTFDEKLEKRIIDKSVDKVLKILERKAER